MTRLALFALALVFAGCSGGAALSSADLDRMGDAVGCFEIETIGLDDSVSGRLDSSDCDYGDTTYADYYAFRVDERTRVTITESSSDFDAYMTLYDADGESIETDDDTGGGVNGYDAEISRTLNPGLYIVAANSISQATGAYRLTLSTD